MRRKLVPIFSIIIVIALVSIVLALGSNKAAYITIDADKAQADYNLLAESLKEKRYSYLDIPVTADYELDSSTASVANGESKNGYAGLQTDLVYDMTASYEFDMQKEGWYELELDYFLSADILSNVVLEVKVNGEIQFDEAKIIDIPVMWQDVTKEFTIDTYGDETLPPNARISNWSKVPFYNNTYYTNTPLRFKLNSGKNIVEIRNISSGKISVGSLTAKAPEKIVAYNDYIKDYANTNISFYDYVNAIEYISKNTSLIRMSSYRSDSVSPFDPINKKLNIIDGAGWSKPGQKIDYIIRVPETGLYKIGLHYFNNKNDFSVFRTIEINGKTPFKEMYSYEFDCTGDGVWTNKVLEDTDGNPYYFYLEKGEHTLSLKAENDIAAKSVVKLQLLIDHINQFALEIRKITGKDIDKDRSWKLTKYIPEVDTYLHAYENVINSIIFDMQNYAPNGSNSSTLSYLKKALVKIDQMREKPDELPLYFEDLYSGNGAVTQMLGDTMTFLQQEPMFLDGIYVFNNTKLPKAQASIFKSAGSGLTSFFSTFVTQKYVIRDDPQAVNIWVSRSIMYIDLMQKLVESDFTAKTGIKVKISVMPDANKLVLANAANQMPDIAMGMPSHLPYDLSIRGAAYDLTQFEDFWSVASRFPAGNFMPYIYNDGVYAVPETTDFNALVYRKDIFRALDLPIPSTWDELKNILPSLQRYGMNFYQPIAGGISLKWFYQTAPFVMQYGGKLYTDDGLTTRINDEEGVKGVTALTELFTTYALPVQVPIFYNSFRNGMLPIGITDFNVYMQIKNAAPELKGQWGLADMLGTTQDNGEVLKWFIANGTGAIIMQATDKAEESWEFLKWWTSEEVQTSYSFMLQSTFGEEYVWLSSNIDALKNAPIDEIDKRVIINQLDWIYDVPRTPGQYMLERGLSDIWNKAISDGVNPRVGIDKQSIVINREIRRKMTEFGFVDNNGDVIKPYVIRDIDWINQKMSEGSHSK